MARKLFGAGLIAFAFLLLWVNSQPETTIKRRHRQSQTWVARTIRILQKAQPFLAKPSPLCNQIQDQADTDETLDSYRLQLTRVTLLSQIQDNEVKAMLEKCLATTFPANPQLQNGFEMEIDVFDTSGADTADRPKNTRAWKTGRSVTAELEQNLVLQFSFMDSQTANKVAEAAMSIGYDVIEKSRPHEGQKKTR